MRRCLALCMLWFAWPAHADLAAGQAALKECQARAATPTDMGRCLGLVAEACISGERGATEGFCHTAEAMSWMQSLAGEAAAFRDLAADRDAQDAFEASQDRWQAWRDAECDFRQRLARAGGDDGQRAFDQCVGDLTAARMAALRSIMPRD
ncbi:MAG: DUF1311 domain-containing protein [Tabrizicola sp.]|nr:DUF1311 domain-containing protein [Tabrizicola sp.]